MRFLIDNALLPMRAERLRQGGHDALHVRDLGLQSAADEIIFDRARLLDRNIVSADTDFGTLITLRQEAKPSVILFRQPYDRRPDRQVACRMC